MGERMGVRFSSTHHYIFKVNFDPFDYCSKDRTDKGEMVCICRGSQMKRQLCFSIETVDEQSFLHFIPLRLP